MEQSTYRITWYGASALTPSGGIETATWGDDALGNGRGVIQADLVIKNLMRILNSST